MTTSFGKVSGRPEVFPPRAITRKELYYERNIFRSFSVLLHQILIDDMYDAHPLSIRARKGFIVQIMYT